jgi:hypothetical protein
MSWSWNMEDGEEWLTNPPGRYEGTVQAEWLVDGRKMRLLADFGYWDPNEVKWTALTGSVVDGASIPQFAWSLIGGPFEGKYRDASVIHDVACDEKSRPWDAVHLVFYEAMLTSGVKTVLAKIMYAAVYHFGPRWPTIVQEVVSGRGKIGALGAEVGSESGTGVPGWEGADSPTEFKTTEVAPPAATLAESQFEVLKTLIEQREQSGAPSMSLAEIREFGEVTDRVDR